MRGWSSVSCVGPRRSRRAADDHGRRISFAPTLNAGRHSYAAVQTLPPRRRRGVRRGVAALAYYGTASVQSAASRALRNAAEALCGSTRPPRYTARKTVQRVYNTYYAYNTRDVQCDI